LLARADRLFLAYKILLATDNHIGYAESDPVRGRDSINTFREILQLAIANDVSCAALRGLKGQGKARAALQQQSNSPRADSSLIRCPSG